MQRLLERLLLLRFRYLPSSGAERSAGLLSALERRRARNQILTSSRMPILEYGMELELALAVGVGEVGHSVRSHAVRVAKCRRQHFARRARVGGAAAACKQSGAQQRDPDRTTGGYATVCVARLASDRHRARHIRENRRAPPVVAALWLAAPRALASYRPGASENHFRRVPAHAPRARPRPLGHASW